MNKKVDCIKRMIENGLMYEELTSWLVDNKLLTHEIVSSTIFPQYQAEIIYEALVKAEKDGKISLVYFEWVYLPIETIKLTCVTESEKKEFTYGY
jgi:hypothetical protein